MQAYPDSYDSTLVFLGDSMDRYLQTRSTLTVRSPRNVVWLISSVALLQINFLFQAERNDAASRPAW